MKKLCCFTIAVRLADTRSLYRKTIEVQRLSAYVIPLILYIPTQPGYLLFVHCFMRSLNMARAYFASHQPSQ